MILRTKLFSILLFVVAFNSIAKEKFIISGIVSDSASGERLAFVSVSETIQVKNSLSNNYGFFSIKLEKGKNHLVFSSTGYSQNDINIELFRDTFLHIELVQKITSIEEVVVSQKTNKLRENQMGMHELALKQTEKLPVILGEHDILKTLQLLPGIKGGMEGTSGIFVRGGSPDQNLILLDNVPVYNVNHLFGVFSVFNTDAIQSVSIIKGGFPAHYGGRLSSVIDIKMKEGNNKKICVNASIGLISSHLTVEGPVVNENTSFILSGRRTYLDFITSPIVKAKDPNTDAGYYFYDLNAKINHRFSDKSHVYLSFYTGKDNGWFNYKSVGSYYDEKVKTGNVINGIDWRNITASARWNYLISSKIFINTTFIFSNYKFLVNNSYNDYNKDKNTTIDLYFDYSSGIIDNGIKTDFDYFPDSRNNMKFGASAVRHAFSPGVSAIEASGSEIPTSNYNTGNEEISAIEMTCYAEDEIEITKKLSINAGMHFSTFDVQDTSYYSLQPRISIRYMLTDKVSVKASFVTMQQYIHLLTNTTIGLPTDLWLPSTKHIKPQIAQQVAIGFTYFPDEKAIDFTLEAYYKNMNHVIDYAEGATFMTVENKWEDKIQQGKGWAKGIELLTNFHFKKVKGWIAYTLSKSERQFEKINFGNTYPFRYDRRHEISIVANFYISEKIDFGSTWVYSTGDAVTIDKYNYSDNLNLMFWPFDQKIKTSGSRNSYRMPAYHRLDLSFNYNRKKAKYATTFSCGVYNVYNQMNPFFLDIEHDASTGKAKIVQYTLLPFIPFVRYEIRF
jgi:outer membrane receptor for ferrienterochelin and colicin